MHSEVEGKNLAASPAEGDQFAYSREHIPPLSDTEHKDQSREIESVALKQPSHSDPKEAQDNTELFPATEIENDTIAASATGEIKTSHQSVSLLEISSDNIPDEASKELNKLMDDPANSIVAQNDGIEAAPSKEQMIAGSERDITDNSSKLSGDSSLMS